MRWKRTLTVRSSTMLQMAECNGHKTALAAFTGGERRPTNSGRAGNRRGKWNTPRQLSIARTPLALCVLWNFPIFARLRFPIQINVTG